MDFRINQIIVQSDIRLNIDRILIYECDKINSWNILFGDKIINGRK